MKNNNKKPLTLGEIYINTLDGKNESKEEFLKIIRCIVEDYLCFFKISKSEQQNFIDYIEIFAMKLIGEINNKKEIISFDEFTTLLNEEIVEQAKQYEILGIISKRERKK